MDFGWKKKAAHLKMVILSAGHQPAMALPRSLSRVLELYGHVARTGDVAGLQEAIATIERSDDPKMLWEPTEIYGWKIEATLYLQEGQLWWLVHAQRRTAALLRDKEIAILDKVLDLLGADPKRHAIIGPHSSPPGEDPVPFGWWTWRNRDQLYDVHVNKDKKGKDAVRIVPLGSRETDGYESVLLDRKADLDE